MDRKKMISRFTVTTNRFFMGFNILSQKKRYRVPDVEKTEVGRQASIARWRPVRARVP